jgi:hypothetical protein
MFRNFHLHLALPCLLGLLVAACNAPQPAAPTSTSSGPPQSAEDISNVSPLADEGHGDGYEYHIRYPELAPEWNVLNQALHAYATERKRQFLANLPPTGERTANATTAVLDLEFDVARRTEDFVSVLARGTVLAGAAGGTPIAASFVLHPTTGKLLSIVDLFTTPPAALQALSDESRRQLEGRYEANLRQSIGDGNALATQLKEMQAGVEHGTTPDAANFNAFLIDGIDSKAIGLTLIFPQTQLAANSDGEQQIEVPAKVFRALLNPEYREAFIENDTIAPNASGR